MKTFMETEWADIFEPMATSEQRRALYKFGVQRHLVKKLTAEQTSTLIQTMAAARQALGPSNRK